MNEILLNINRCLVFLFATKVALGVSRGVVTAGGLARASAQVPAVRARARIAIELHACAQRGGRQRVRADQHHLIRAAPRHQASCSDAGSQEVAQRSPASCHQLIAGLACALWFAEPSLVHAERGLRFGLGRAGLALVPRGNAAMVSTRMP